MQDPYEILGVARTATNDGVRKAYRKLAKTLHPGPLAGSTAGAAPGAKAVRKTS